MRLELQPAFVLHSRPYRETSLLLECLTRDQGRLGVVARGVRGEKARLRRSQLEPFQPLALGLLLRGEMATLTGVEMAGPPLRLAGNAGLAGLYLNELVVRLSERQDPSLALFDAYALALQRLASGEPMAWSLRRFERDLLQAIGYGLQLEHDASTGELLDSDAYYEYRVEQGAVAGSPGRGATLRGADLLALAHDQLPGDDGLKALRGMMREVISFHLGGGELRAWRVLAGATSWR